MTETVFKRAVRSLDARAQPPLQSGARASHWNLLNLHLYKYLKHLIWKLNLSVLLMIAFAILMFPQPI